MATFTASANTGTTESTIISSIVQDELLRSAKLRPTITDMSSMAQKGVKSIDVPRFSASFSGPAAQNVDGTTATTAQTATFSVDSIDLNDWTSIVYKIPDRISTQTVLNLEADLAKSAGQHYGNFVDDQIIVQLKLASASTPDHLLGLGESDTGGAGAAVTLGDVSKWRQLLNRQNCPQEDRFMVIPPEMEKTLIDLDNFRNADKYGSREALLQGEIGQIYGFRVLVHNGLAANEALAYHKTSCAIAVQQEVRFESRREELGLQSTEYSFAMGMGQKVLQGGVVNIYAIGA